MSVSSSYPGDDEDEVHDLVLMFANSRMPRGSDAFQSIMGDLLPSDDNDSSDTASVVSQPGKDTEDKKGLDEVDAASAPKEVRIASPKPLAHVHWPDANNRKIASSPARGQRHHARLYVKKTPVKPILKHEDDDIVPNDGRCTSHRVPSLRNGRNSIH